MAFMIHRGAGHPSVAVAVCAVTLTTMPWLMPSVDRTCLGLRWWGARYRR